MKENFQRKGAISNAHVGRAFEKVALGVLNRSGIPVIKNFPVEVGISEKRKVHEFDLGSKHPPVLVECKSHRWTKGNNVPSAKITVWNEAMYLFFCAPDEYRKIFFILRDKRGNTGETLSSYYIRNYSHLIPSNTEIWEFDESTSGCEIVYSS